MILLAQSKHNYIQSWTSVDFPNISDDFGKSTVQKATMLDDT